MTTAAEIIRARREERGLSIAELARRSLIPRERLSKIENGRIGVGPKTAARLAPHLGIDPAELLRPEVEPANLSTVLARLAELAATDAVLVRGVERVLDRLDAIEERLAERQARARRQDGAPA